MEKSQVLKENLFCSTFNFINIHFIRYAIVQRLVNSLEIVENDVEVKASQSLDVVRRIQIKPFVLDVPPEMFGENVVKGTSAPIAVYMSKTHHR